MFSLGFWWVLSESNVWKNRIKATSFNILLLSEVHIRKLITADESSSWALVLIIQKNTMINTKKRVPLLT
jgi:hypothetical protein